MKSQTKPGQSQSDSQDQQVASSSDISSSLSVLSILRSSSDGSHTHTHTELHLYTPRGKNSFKKEDFVSDIDVSVGSDGVERKQIDTSFLSVSSSSRSFSSSRTETHTSITKTHVEIHPFDMLEVGKEYKVTNFTGSCPGMVGASLVTKDKLPPVFHHEACTLRVTGIDDKGKHIHVKATRKDLKDENCDYGIVGPYELEMTLKKDATGQVICTSLKGLSGRLAIPGIILKPLELASYLKSWTPWGSSSTTAWDDIVSYNTGTKAQKLPVSIIPNQDGTFQLKATVDPNLLELEGATATMLAVSKKADIACPAFLEGNVDLKLDKRHRRDGDGDSPSRSRSRSR